MVDTYLDTNRLDGWMVMVVIIEYHMAHVTRRPNTNMPNLVWLVVVVIKHISYIIWPMRRPNTNMLISVWMDGDGGHYQISHDPCHKTQYQHDRRIYSMDGGGCHHRTTYGLCQDPIPICEIEYGCYGWGFIWWSWSRSSNNTI